MVLELENKGATKSLKGFKLSSNNYVDILEQNLGITFPFKPALVELKGRNRFVYAGKGGIAGVIAAFITRNYDVVAQYDHDYKACFAGEDAGLFYLLHENMHPFNVGTNYEIYATTNQLSNVMALRAAGQSAPSIDLEKIAVLRSLDEGMAQWAAIESALKMTKDFDPGDLRGLQNDTLRGQRENGDVKSDETFIDVNFDRLHRSIMAYQTAFELRGLKAFKEGAKAEGLLRDSVYTAGYYFVYNAMPILLSSGLSPADGINYLLKNPPTKLQTLRSPQTYLS